MISLKRELMTSQGMYCHLCQGTYELDGAANKYRYSIFKNNNVQINLCGLCVKTITQRYIKYETMGE